MSILSLIRRELANAFLHDARRAIFLFGAATAYLILFGILSIIPVSSRRFRQSSATKNIRPTAVS